MVMSAQRVAAGGRAAARRPPSRPVPNRCVEISAGAALHARQRGCGVVSVPFWRTQNDSGAHTVPFCKWSMRLEAVRRYTRMHARMATVNTRVRTALRIRDVYTRCVQPNFHGGWEPGRLTSACTLCPSVLHASVSGAHERGRRNRASCRGRVHAGGRGRSRAAVGAGSNWKRLGRG